MPRASQAPGFVAGYWTRRGDAGLSFIVFESEEAARAASEQIQSPDPSAATVEHVDVRAVVAHA